MLVDKIREVGIKVPLGETTRNGDARKGTQGFGSPIMKRSKEIPRKPVSEARVDVRGVILIRELGILKFSYFCWKLERYSCVVASAEEDWARAAWRLKGGIR